MGCNNGTAQYRMAEVILICGLDKVVCMHRTAGKTRLNVQMLELVMLFHGSIKNVLKECVWVKLKLCLKRRKE